MSEKVLAALRDDRLTKDDRNILRYQKDGYMILVGRNSFSNDSIIKNHGHPECLWMHAMASRGSHVILCIKERPDPSELIIQYAAALALDHSHSQARTVWISLLRDVFKPDNAGIGVWKTSKAESIEVLDS